jgi:gas vesicle protein
MSEDVEDVKEELTGRVDELFEEKTEEIELIMANSKNPLTDVNGEVREELNDNEDDLTEEEKEMEELDKKLNRK